MTDKLDLLAKMMSAFAHRHWDDGYSSARARLSIEGERLTCTVEDETIAGDAGAPLMFLSGAWGLIFAHECDGRFGHRVDGRVNRVWPNGAGRSLVEHGIDEEVRAWAAAWPDVLFSSHLYEGVTTPGYPRRPRVLEDAPSRTKLHAIMKRVAAHARDADPLERLKVTEFIEFGLRREWSMTAEDKMMAAVGAPLMAADDPVPAIRELAILALETCAERCWQQRAYGLYEPICTRLVDEGFNAQAQFVRLAESAYASGEIGEGDRLWATGTAGQDPLRAVKLSSGYDIVGDWSDLHTRILRQAGGAAFARSNGHDPNPARQAKLDK